MSTNSLRLSDPETFVKILVAVSTATTLATLRDASSRYLEPIYGNVFPYHRLQDAAMIFFALGLLVGPASNIYDLPLKNRSNILTSLLDTVAILLALSPIVVEPLFKFSSQWGPIWGPHLTQIPLLYGTTFVLGVLSGFTIRWYYSIMFYQLLYQYAVITLASSCQQILLCSTILCIASFTLKVFTVSKIEQIEQSSIRQSNYLKLLTPQVLILLTLIFTITKAKHLGNINTPQEIPGTNWHILAGNESTTGWIEVLEENQRMNMRVMRAGHSLLGGRFLGTGESIFATFHLLEGILAFDRPKVDATTRALQIGLGCGISTNGLIKHGVSVDVVELDPVVYYMARDYFDLEQPNTVHLENGREFLQRVDQDTYDFVLHDIFTGGSVAPKMFSLELLQLVKHALKPNGILAMNFVGSEQPEHRKGLDLVATTLSSMFENVQCYRDSDDSSVKFTNYVFFAADIPLKFHSKRINQIFEGHTAKVLAGWHQNSVSVNNITNGVLTDRSLRTLEKAGANAALDHWLVMRQIFGDDFWLHF
ncbi:hypothetical protein INT43_002101 [Umbelopsis isabellina]|uniref:PABS domain-containing protein n=1 Tax=Mortierella isabellina TaxID=91625 RepID=A0A8H7PU33_MORIS|nr:hypothetical protein INT43_002101 [Umbelopsis isabellina]